MGRNNVSPEEVIKRNKQARENLISLEKKYLEHIKGNETLEIEFIELQSDERAKFKLLRKFRKEFIRPKSINKQLSENPNDKLLNQFVRFKEDLKRSSDGLSTEELEEIKIKIADVIPLIDNLIQDKIETEIKEKENEIQKLRVIKEKYLKV